MQFSCPELLGTVEKNEPYHRGICNTNCKVFCSGPGRRQRAKFLNIQNETLNYVRVGFHGGSMAMAKVSKTESHTREPCSSLWEEILFLTDPTQSSTEPVYSSTAYPQPLLHESHKNQLCLNLLSGPSIQGVGLFLCSHSWMNKKQIIPYFTWDRMSLLAY